MIKFKVKFTTRRDVYNGKPWKSVVIEANTKEEAEERAETSLPILFGDQFYQYDVHEVIL